MKITTGLGTLDDYIDFTEAGTDEVFAGFVPQEWSEKAGIMRPLNRREVQYYNVQLGSYSELQILAKMVDRYKVPVTLTFNSPYYDPDFYELIISIMERCAELGFKKFIVGDTGLLVHIRKSSLKNIEVHLSGEFGEINEETFEALKGFSISRLIYHRHTGIDAMKKLKGMHGFETEAFVLNERCQFCGGYCSTFHCDELAPACRIRYKAANMKEESEENKIDVVGSTGCGLCALYKLKEAGVDYLKIVSRGGYSEDTIRDIRALRTALRILDKSGSEDEFIYRMKLKLFKDGCSNNCYYLSQD